MKRTVIYLLLVAIILSLCSCNSPVQSSTTSSPIESKSNVQVISTTNETSTTLPEVNQSTFYVSPSGRDDIGDGSIDKPWKTITKARDYLRTISDKMTSDIFVYLRGGTYTVKNPITFEKEDSGKNGFIIHYENYTGEKPELSGGKEVTDWKLYDSDRNIYRTFVGNRDRFRQLYVNEKRAILARTPNIEEDTTGGPYYIGGKWNYLNKYEYPYPKPPYTFKVKSTTVPEWDQSSPLELVTIDHWRLKMARISNFSVKENIATISFKNPETNNGIFSHANQYLDPVFSPYYFQNSLEFLDAAGEWYLDKFSNAIYYKPRPGEDMSNARIVAPDVETIIDISSDNGGEDSVRNITFKGLIIDYSNWTLPNINGYSDIQASLICVTENNVSKYIPGTIQLSNADNICFDSCTIKHTGANAILASDFERNSVVSNCKFQNNIVSDTSAGGIYLFLNTERSTGNIIQNNLIEHGGMDYADAVGILLGCIPDAQVLHNEVCYLGYGGISVGWCWDDSVTAAKNIEVAYNKIHHVMQLLDDSAGIYSLGNIPGCKIHDNYISNIEPSKYAGFDPESLGNIICGIYFDQGSTNKTAYSNVIDNTAYAFNAPNTPNLKYLIKDNFYNCKIGNVPLKSNFKNNIFVEDDWPEAAQKIIENSGIIRN